MRQRTYIAIALFLATAGCASVHHEVLAPRPVCVRGVIFVLDGAGDFGATSTSLRRALAESGVPLEVNEVDWSHGYARILADQTDAQHSQEQGCCLAGRIVSYRQLNPTAEIYILAHSAGSATALAAAEALPANSVDRMVLLSPAVCAFHDLRPALRAARDGIDVFYSSRDVAYLGFWTAVLGTADGARGCPAAGRTGFAPTVASAADAALYAKLRQHAWTPCVAWSGNHGGHYGGYQTAHLRAYVLPLLSRCAVGS